MIRVEGLHKSYGDRVAVRGLDLSVEPGRLHALLGRNGAGKSTAMHCMVGLLKPDRGTIRLDGVDLADRRAEALRRVSYLPEVAAVYEALTPEEFLALRGRLFGMDEAAIAAGSAAWLGRFGLADRSHEPMAGFSKGMVQKAALAAALLTEPRVLVLDEPITGLDVVSTLELKELLRELARGGRTVLFSSHLLDVVENLAEWVTVIEQGRVVAEGTVAEVRRLAGDAASLEAAFQHLVH